MNQQPDWISFDEKKIHSPFFPVALCPAKYEVEIVNGNGLFTKENRDAIRHRAVVDLKKNIVFAMVTDEYKLVTNEEALEMGRDCFRTVFERIDVVEMELFNVIMPKKRSFCHMDLVYGQASSNYFDNDPWTPYASRPKLEVGETGRIHTLQIASGIWIEDFANEAKRPDFSIADYLGAHLELAG